MLRSPDRSIQPAQEFGNALRSDQRMRRESSIRDELLRNISVKPNAIPRANSSNMELNHGVTANNRFSRQRSAVTDTTEIDGHSFQVGHLLVLLYLSLYYLLFWHISVNPKF